MSGAGASATTAQETEPPKETEKGEAEKEEEGEELELKPADVLKDANKLVKEGKTREAVTSVLDAMLKPLAAAKELFGISQGIACGLGKFDIDRLIDLEKRSCITPEVHEN